MQPEDGDHGRTLEDDLQLDQLLDLSDINHQSPLDVAELAHDLDVSEVARDWRPTRLHDAYLATMSDPPSERKQPAANPYSLKASDQDERKAASDLDGKKPKPCENAAADCWGAVLSGTHAKCTPGFQIGAGHFKNKFCGRCTRGVEVPLSRVRACTTELAAALSVSSKQQPGFWKASPAAYGGVRMRLVNNTMQCLGPWLACYEGTPPALDWAEMPSEWVDHTAQTITLMISKGTLVPAANAFKRVTKRKGPPAASEVLAANEAHNFLKNENSSGSVSPTSDPTPAESGDDNSSRSSSFTSKRAARQEDAERAEVRGGRSRSTPFEFSVWPHSIRDQPILRPWGNHGNTSSSGTSPTTLRPTAVHSALAPPMLAQPSQAQPSQAQSFLDTYLQVQQQMADLIQQRLSDDDGSMPIDERSHLQQQLHFATSLLSAANNSTLIHWRSLPDDVSPRAPHQDEVSNRPRTSMASASDVVVTDPLDTTAGVALNGVSMFGSDSGGDRGSIGGGAAFGASRLAQRFLLIASGLGLKEPTHEVNASVSTLISAGAICTCSDTSLSASALNGLLVGQDAVFFSGHTGANDDEHHGRTLAFVRGGVAEHIDSEALTSMVAAHRATLKFVILNGCRSLHLALQLVHAGLPAVACWETAVADEAAALFGIGLARGLAQGRAIPGAFDAGVAAILSATELAPSGRRWVPKFALVSPETSGADARTGRLPQNHASAGCIAAGLPWLIRPLPAHRLHEVPLLPAAYTPRPPLEQQAIDFISAHRLRSASHSIADGTTPRSVGPAVLVLLGAKGCGKTTLATWICRELRTQSIFPDGIYWVDAGSRKEEVVEEEEQEEQEKVRTANAPFQPTPGRYKSMGRQRCLVVLDGVPEGAHPPPQVTGGSYEQLIVVTTCDPFIASALSRPGCLTLTIASVLTPEVAEDDRRQSSLLSPRDRRVARSMQMGNQGEDPESFSPTWTVIVQILAFGLILAFGYESHRLATDFASLHRSLVMHVEERPSNSTPGLTPFEIMPMWITLIVQMPYLTLLVCSPANERLTFGVIELGVWWAAFYTCANAYTIFGYAAIVRTVSHAAAAGTQTTASPDGGISSDLWAYGQLLAAAVASLGWHISCMLTHGWQAWALLQLLRPRPGAPRFREALDIGLLRFKRAHGKLIGTLLSMPFTALPCSTFSYYLVDGNYFLQPVSQAYKEAWRIAGKMYLVGGIASAAYYVAICALSDGKLARAYLWVLLICALNLFWSMQAAPKNWRRNRAVLFPEQSIESTRMRV